MPTQAKCPTCGAPIAFRPGTMVAVCGYCKSLSARTDRDLKLIGKVADLVDTGSPLRVGVEGQYEGRRFTLVGRTQLKHPLGGVWDEWYLALDDGRWGWLAEAQGHFYLTFKQEADGPLPVVETLQPSEALNLGKLGVWWITEVSRGAFASAEGEIPWAVELGGSYPFADLSGPQGAFATLDYSEDPPLFFSGREIAFDDLKIREQEKIPGLGIGSGSGSALGSRPSPSPAPKLKAQNLPCPHCASPLLLRAPDQTLRVTCPSCGSLLDASEGRLSFLKSLKQPNPRMFIPLGTEGNLQGVPLTCIGYLLRSCTIEGMIYTWGEYLMLDSHHGFRWLVESDGHWSLAESISQGAIRETTAVSGSVAYIGEYYRCFQRTTAVVDGVYGEFYWQVEQGEKVQVAEYVRAPISLAEEVQSQPGGGREVNWSRSTYLAGAEIWKAFKLQGAPPVPQGIAPHQPNPHWKTAQQVGLWMVAAFALLVLVLGWEAITHREKLLFKDDYNLYERVPALQDLAQGKTPAPADQANPAPAGAAPENALEPVFFTEPFEIEDGHKNFAVSLNAPVDNSWIGVEGALVSETTGAAEVFEVASSYYHGSDEDGPWTEGSRTETVYLSAVPAGKYVLRIAPVWDGKLPPVPTFSVEVRTGITRWIYGLLVVVGIALFPLLAWLRALAFENRRWQESMYTSSRSSSEDD